MSSNFLRFLVADSLARILYSQLYCKIHKIPLIHIKYIENETTSIETGYCSKCQKEYCEYSDISPVYISNYEWLYEN